MQLLKIEKTSDFIRPNEFLTFISLLFILFSQISIKAQDVAELAMRARINLYEKWNFDSVEHYLDKIIDRKHTPAFAYSDYGWYLLLKGQNQRGMESIRRAAEMDPVDVQLTTWYSWALLWKNDVAEATRWIERALEIDPKNGEALHVACRIALKRTDYEEALKYAKSVAANSSPWRAILPLVYAKIGEPEQALKWAQSFANEKQASDYWMLAETYINLDMSEKALKFLHLAYDTRYPFMPWLRIDPGLSSLKDTPLFNKIVTELRPPE